MLLSASRDINGNAPSTTEILVLVVIVVLLLLFVNVTNIYIFTRYEGFHTMIDTKHDWYAVGLYVYTKYDIVNP